MSTTRRTVLIALAAVPACAALPALAADDKATTVEVSLWDKPDMDMRTDLGFGMNGDMSKANMGIDLGTDTVPAGEVDFRATNASEVIEHEMIVAPLPADGKPLPYDEGSARVDEDAANSIGEVSELAPGEKGSLTLHLDPGKYILYCNVAGHYMAGMWTILTVT